MGRKYYPPRYQSTAARAARNFGLSSTLDDHINRPLPARLGLFHSLQCGLGDLCGNVLLIPFPLLDDRVYSLARTRQRFRCLEVGNRLSRGLTALAVFVIAGKIGIAAWSGPLTSNSLDNGGR